MKFLILGAGALGSILAAHLARAGTPVALLARGRRADHVAAHGVTLTGLVDCTVPVPVVRPGEATDADVLILCTKAFDTAQALDGVRLARPPIALSLQNGVLKNDELVARYGADQVLGATASISGELLDDGTTRFTMNQALPIGELGGGPSARVADIVGALKSSGIAAEASDDIRSVEWTKYAGFLPLFAPALLTRQYTWRNLSDPDTAIAIARLIRETCALAAASGVRILDQKGLPLNTIAAAPPEEGARLVRSFGAVFGQRAPLHRVSALQDLLRGGRLEVDAILGYAVALGRRLGVAVPTIETCHQLCAVLNRPPE